MPDEAKTVLVHPKPGVTLYLAGGVHGFDAAAAAQIGGVPLRAEHATALSEHVMTADEKKAAEAVEAGAAKKKPSATTSDAPGDTQKA